LLASKNSTRRQLDSLRCRFPARPDVRHGATRFLNAMHTLKYKSATTIPVEAERVRPDLLAGKTAAEIAKLPVQHGRRRRDVADRRLDLHWWSKASGGRKPSEVF
jgi:hypothetical protein